MTKQTKEELQKELKATSVIAYIMMPFAMLGAVTTVINSVEYVADINAAVAQVEHINDRLDAHTERLDRLEVNDRAVRAKVGEPGYWSDVELKPGVSTSGTVRSYRIHNH